MTASPKPSPSAGRGDSCSGSIIRAAGGRRRRRLVRWSPRRNPAVRGRAMLRRGSSAAITIRPRAPLSSSLRVTTRVGGSSRKRPNTSLMKPGTISSELPKITSTPSTTSRVGARPAASAPRNLRQARRPCERSSTVPRIEEANRSAIVGSAPIAWPTWMITYSSAIGTRISNSRSRMNIVLVRVPAGARPKGGGGRTALRRARRAGAARAPRSRRRRRVARGAMLTPCSRSRPTSSISATICGCALRSSSVRPCARRRRASITKSSISEASAQVSSVRSITTSAGALIARARAGRRRACVARSSSPEQRSVGGCSA